jgi:hypothetical protein
MSSLGCVHCDPTNTHWQPTKFYILDGNSVCEYCLRKIQTQNEDPDDPYEEDPGRYDQVKIDEGGQVTAFAEHTGLTLKLFASNGTCLMTSPVASPVITGDSISFPPIKISL